MMIIKGLAIIKSSSKMITLFLFFRRIFVVFSYLVRVSGVFVERNVKSSTTHRDSCAW